MTVVDIKTKRKRSLRSPPLGPATSDAGRYLERVCHDIEVDLGGRRELTRIEIELIRGFAGAATVLKYLNVQVALGETGELDLAGYATVASTMLRLGAKLGLSRRKAKTSKPTYGDIADYERLEQPPAAHGAAPGAAAAGAADVGHTDDNEVA
jgi:hypothetical protein